MKKYKYVIIGGGTAAGFAAEEFVSQGILKNQLLIIGEENMLPMNRPPFSKDFLTGSEKTGDILIQDQHYYDQHGIDVLTGTRAAQAIFGKKLVILDNGVKVKYEKLMIATGSRVIKLDIPGADNHVLYLRSMDDARKIKEKALNAKNAVIIGGQFIATEVGASLKQLGLDVTIIFQEKYLMNAFASEELGIFFNHLFSSRGVKLKGNSKVVEIKNKDGRQLVVPDSGEPVEADMVIAGVGVKPDIEVFRDTELVTGDGIVINEYCETSIPDVYAAGDVAYFPNIVTGKSQRLEHWQNAHDQAKLAAKNMTGHHLMYSEIPYYFSDLFDFSYEFYGDLADSENHVLKGKPNKEDFSIFWTRKNNIVAAFISSRRPETERTKSREWIMNRNKVNLEILNQTDAAFETALL